MLSSAPPDTEGGGILVYLEDNEAFRLGSSPVLYTPNHFTIKYGWYVQRIGRTAMLTNYLSSKMDPTVKSFVVETTPLDDMFFELIGAPLVEPNATVEGDNVTPTTFKLDALEVHVHSE